MHTAFEAELRALGNPMIFTEISYLGGQVVRRGTPGSVRVDAVSGTSVFTPQAAFDLKTGGAILSSRRGSLIQGNLPFPNIPIMVIRP